MTTARALALGVTAVVAAATVAGLALLDSPSVQRQRHIDAHRLRDIEQLAQAIDAYAQRHHALPLDLRKAHQELGLRLALIDPETGAPYDYALAGADGYRLCGVFALDSSDQDRSYPYPGGAQWEHGAGRVCFERTVAPGVIK